VVIRSRSGGYETIVSVEAVARERARSVDYVEGVIAKHDHLPTNKLILVSETGFSREARAVAEAEGVTALAPEDVGDDDPAGRIVAAIPALWPKVVEFNPIDFGVVFDDRDVPDEGWGDEIPVLYLDDSTRIEGTLADFVLDNYRTQLPDLMNQIGVAAVSKDEERRFHLEIREPKWRIDGQERRVCLLNEDGRLYSLRTITAEGIGKITVSDKIAIKHRRLGELDVQFAYGEGKVAGRDALIVMSGNQEAGKLTVRVRPETRADS
jgi:hypothetical protein